MLHYTGGADYNDFPMFSIHPNDGVVQVAGKLDYESKSQYNLNISVTDGYNTVYTGVSVYSY